MAGYNKKPSVLTDDTLEDILACADLGHNDTAICKQLGLLINTFAKWKMQGEKDKEAEKDSMFRKLYEGLRKRRRGAVARVKAAMLAAALGESVKQETMYDTDSKGKRTEVGYKETKQADHASMKSFLQMYGELDEQTHVRHEIISPGSPRPTIDEWEETYLKQINQESKDE